MSEPLRIGVLGAARISELAIAVPARAIGARLVAVAARDRHRAEDFACKYGVERVHPSYDALLSDPDVEVVYNPLVNSLHGPWNLRAISAGKHVLTEKPSASNALEAAQVRDAAQAANVTVVEGFHYLYHPLFQRALNLLANGAIGALQRVEAPMSMAAPVADDPRWEIALAGGATMDLGCYSIHAVRMIGRRCMGEPTLVRADAGERNDHPGVDEWLIAEFEYPGGGTAAAGCNMAAPVHDFSLTLIGEQGTMHVPNFVQPHLDDRLTLRTPAGSRTERLGPRSSYTYQLEALSAHLRSGAELPISADDAVAQMKTVDAAYVLAGFEPRATARSALPG